MGIFVFMHPVTKISAWLAFLVGAAALPARAHVVAPAGAATGIHAPAGSNLVQTHGLLSSREIRTGAGLDPAGRPTEMSDQEYLTFSGVGAIVCTVDGRQRMSTAFLVGAFDLAVTVAHAFEADTAPEDCVYNTTDSLGQIRERIPVAYIKSQWEDQTAQDLAVVRLSAPSRFAQRTMPLGRFSGRATPVLIVGFRAEMDVDTVKRKSHGTVYERRDAGLAAPVPTGLTHDMDSRGIAPGAPVIDERSGVIIGIHTRVSPDSERGIGAARNAVITMDDWLERTLRSEMQTQAEAASP